jgi:hypothetical protein
MEGEAKGVELVRGGVGTGVGIGGCVNAVVAAVVKLGSNEPLEDAAEG